jgi:hypothetical protein
MIKRKFGWTGVKVPIVGQGTWLIDSGGGFDRSRRIGTIHNQSNVFHVIACT